MHSLGEFKPPLQDFSQLGIDTEVAALIMGDLAKDNPDRYENAGIWGGLIIEATTASMEESDFGGVDKEEFIEFLFSTLKDPAIAPQKSRLVNELIWTLNYNEIVARDSLFDGDSGMIVDTITWPDSIEEIERYISGVLVKSDQRAFVGNLQSKYHEQGGQMSSDELNALAEELSDAKQADNSSQPDIDPDESDPQGDNLVDEIRYRASLLRELDTIAGSLEPYEELRSQVGAKAANLTRLAEALDKTSEAGFRLVEFLRVPDFMTVDIKTYAQWKEGQPIDNKVSEIANWIQSKSEAYYLIRSSAVHSEDGEHMGAGIYDSALISHGSTPEEIAEAMAKVYSSTDSKTALDYRQSIGIANEAMGLVIQAIVDPNIYRCKLGTINTVMAGNPDLIDYWLDIGGHPLLDGQATGSYRRALPLDRKGAMQEFGLKGWAVKSPQASRFHIPPDTYKHNPSDSWMAAQAGILAEKIAGRPVQVEFVFSDDSQALAIVQSRPLPESFLKRQEFGGFPEEGRIMYEGKASGVIDGVEAIAGTNFLDISRTIEFQDDKEASTLIVIDGSWGLGAGMGQITGDVINLSEEERKKLIVLIGGAFKSSSLGGYGHLETLFSELGVPLIFHDSASAPSQLPKDDQKVVVYANGYHGKVYEAS